MEYWQVGRGATNEQTEYLIKGRGEQRSEASWEKERDCHKVAKCAYVRFILGPVQVHKDAF